MFKLNKKKLKGNTKLDLSKIDSYLAFRMKNCDDIVVKKIRIFNKNIAHPIVYRRVLKKYNKLMFNVSMVLNYEMSYKSLMLSLNMIESFKREIKNKYRNFLKKDEIHEMSNTLKQIKKQLTLQLRG